MEHSGYVNHAPDGHCLHNMAYPEQKRVFGDPLNGFEEVGADSSPIISSSQQQTRLHEWVEDMV